MCTSIISNRNKIIVGWNLDILNMEYKVVPESDKVYIAINDKEQGWLPLFGANARGDFVAMPTCWPFDNRSDLANENNIIMLDIDLLLRKRTFEQIRKIAQTSQICSVPGVTFQSQLSDKNGNVLQIVPGQGYKFLQRPKYSVMTNFSVFKGNKEQHPWMGWDRYSTAKEMLENADDDFDVDECFKILKATSQTICPTVVSMVFDVSQNMVYWCENRDWTDVKMQKIS